MPLRAASIHQCDAAGPVFSQQAKNHGIAESFLPVRSKARRERRPDPAGRDSVDRLKSLDHLPFTLRRIEASFLVTMGPVSSRSASFPIQRAAGCDESARRLAIATEGALSSRFPPANQTQGPAGTFLDDRAASGALRRIRSLR
jgi:hypothetical protein